MVELMGNVPRRYSTFLKPAFCGAVKKCMLCSLSFFSTSTCLENCPNHRENFLQS